MFRSQQVEFKALGLAEFTQGAGTVERNPDKQAGRRRLEFTCSSLAQNTSLTPTNSYGTFHGPEWALCHGDDRP